MAPVSIPSTTTRAVFHSPLGDVERATLRALLGVVFCDENVVRPGWNRLTWDVQVLCTGDVESGWVLTAHWIDVDDVIASTTPEWVTAEIVAALKTIGAAPSA